MTDKKLQDITNIGNQLATDSMIYITLSNGVSTSGRMDQVLDFLEAQPMQFTAPQGSTPVTVTSSSGSINTDTSSGNFFKHTLTENTILQNPTNMVGGNYYQWQIIQHASSAKTLAFGNKFKFIDGNPMVVSTGANAIDMIKAYFDGTNLITTFVQNFS